MTNKLINGFKWLFGKDGTTVTQYILIYLLMYYTEELVELGIPEAIIYTILGVILNLNNNALKAEIVKISDKFKKSDTINQLVKFGMSYLEAMNAVDTPVVQTEIVRPARNPIAKIESKEEKKD